MTRFQIRLSATADICAFVTAATRCPVDVDVVSGRYTVDAKSIMGLFSLKLSEPMQVHVYGSEQDGADFKTAVAEFLAAE